jgi:APA family basic amino acid/polyamine antiporter
MATCIVVANMVGTGIFTSLGFQVAGLPTGFQEANIISSA